MILKFLAGNGCGFLAFICLSSPVTAGPGGLPPGDDAAHLGVATCASSFCHGATSARDSSNVLQNEYLTWQREDPHAGAYNILLNDESAAITRRLGLGKAESEALCLSCHTDNASSTGERFRKDDGIGCETCHGGAEYWIESHAADGRSHAENLEAGLYPLEQPSARARLCQSCHVGDEKRPMQHDLLGAGHPPLLFELDTFSAILPRHHRVDEDYRERKGEPAPVEFWVAGQLEEAARYLAKLDRELVPAHAWPEFSLYNCQSCHHVIESDPARPTRPGQAGLPALRLAPLQKLAVTASVMAPDAGRTFRDSVAKLAKLERLVADAAQPDETLANLRKGLESLRDQMTAGGINRTTWRQLLLAVTRTEALVRGRQGREVVDHRVMSIGVLLQQGKQRGWLAEADYRQLSRGLDRSFALLQDPYDFNAYAVRQSLEDLHKLVQELE